MADAEEEEEEEKLREKEEEILVVCFFPLKNDLNSLMLHIFYVLAVLYFSMYF